jgi:hypothetical protein
MPNLHAISDMCQADVKSGTTCYTKQIVSYRIMHSYSPSNRKRCADQQCLACLARISPYIDRSNARRRSNVLRSRPSDPGSRHAPPMQQHTSNPDTHIYNTNDGLTARRWSNQTGCCSANTVYQYSGDTFFESRKVFETPRGFPPTLQVTVDIYLKPRLLPSKSSQSNQS